MSAGIDWARMSEPQPDGRDTATLLALDRASRASTTSPEPGPTVCDGRVALSCEGPLMPSPPYVAVAGTPEVLARAIDYVGRWPAMAAQWPQIVRVIQPFTDPVGGGPLRSSSHSVDTRPGVIALTVDCPLATAQAIVHETAHLKLRIMGVRNEAADRIVINRPEELYESPVVIEMLRPFTRAREAVDDIERPLIDKRRFERRADPTRGADDDPRAAHARRNRQRSASLSSGSKRYPSLSNPLISSASVRRCSHR